MDVAKGVVDHFMNYNKSDIWSQTYDLTVWYIGPVCGKPNQKNIYEKSKILSKISFEIQFKKHFYQNHFSI